MLLAFVSFFFLLFPALAWGIDLVTLPARQPKEYIIDVTNSSPALALSNVYVFALGTAALVAFGFIVYGALRYASSDSSSVQQEAKERIYQALLGLLLLFAASMILRFINPDLGELRDPAAPGLETIEAPPGNYTTYWEAQGCVTTSGCTASSPDDRWQKIDNREFATVEECKTRAGLHGANENENWRCAKKQKLVEGGASGTAGPDCAPIPSGPGSVADIQARLTGTSYAGCFGSDIELASGVVNVESKGREDAKSGSDQCMPGPRAASVGLFQLNLTWHDVGSLQCASAAPRQAPRGAFSGHFNTSPNDCRIINEARYGECVAAASDPTQNIIAACKAYREGGGSFRRWGPCTRTKCGIDPIPSVSC